MSLIRCTFLSLTFSFFFQLRTLAVKIVNSPTLRADLESCCRDVKIESKLMVRDVSTRWNSTSELVKRAIELKSALAILVVKAEHNRARGVRLKRFQLLPQEWQLLSDISLLLDVSFRFLSCKAIANVKEQIFLFATKKISENQTPLIHHVIPIFDALTTALEDYIDKPSLPLVVRHAALRGFLMLNKYYSKSDESVIYRIAMSMYHSLLIVFYVSIIMISAQFFIHGTRPIISFGQIGLKNGLLSPKTQRARFGQSSIR